MKIVLDSERCQGHGRCYNVAPELFAPDDDGNAIVLVEGDLDPGQEAAAKLAAANCPEYAIDVT